MYDFELPNGKNLDTIIYPCCIVPQIYRSTECRSIKKTKEEASLVNVADRNSNIESTHVSGNLFTNKKNWSLTNLKGRAKSGISEGDLYSSIQFTNLKDFIHRHKKLEDEAGLFYYPDLVLVDEIEGIYIDIEIDEPYEYDGKTATHYYPDTREARRNNFFTDCNWVVLRFSEFQSYNLPKQVIRIIKNVYESLKSNTPFTFSVNGIIVEPRWSYVESQKMAAYELRSNYKDYISIMRNIDRFNMMQKVFQDLGEDYMNSYKNKR